MGHAMVSIPKSVMDRIQVHLASYIHNELQRRRQAYNKAVTRPRLKDMLLYPEWELTPEGKAARDRIGDKIGRGNAPFYMAMNKEYNAYTQDVAAAAQGAGGRPPTSPPISITCNVAIGNLLSMFLHTIYIPEKPEPMEPEVEVAPPRLPTPTRRITNAERLARLPKKF